MEWNGNENENENARLAEKSRWELQVGIGIGGVDGEKVGAENQCGCLLCLLWGNIHLSPAWKQKQHAMLQVARGGCSGRSGDGYCHWSAGQRSSPCLVRLGKTNVRFAFLLASEMKFISCNFAVKGKPTHISLWRQFMKSVTKCTKIITNATVTLWKSVTFMKRIVFPNESAFLMKCQKTTYMCRKKKLIKQ